MPRGEVAPSPMGHISGMSTAKKDDRQDFFTRFIGGLRKAGIPAR